MGMLSRGNVVSTALNLAGNTGLTTQANTWLNAFLGSVYASWAWPFLLRRYGPYTLAAGTASTVVGQGSGSITEGLLRIDRVLLLGASDTDAKQDVELVSSQTVDATDTPGALAGVAKGTPSKALLEISDPSLATTPFRWILNWIPRPDIAYRYELYAYRRPPDLSDDGDGVLYPNDQTLIQAVYVQALRHQADERWVPEDAKLRSLVSEDRLMFGRQPAQNTKLMLARHRRRGL